MNMMMANSLVEKAHSCVFINVYYPGFLNTHYQQNPNIAQASYAEQLKSVQSACFGDSDFYSSGLRASHWQADDLIINCAPLQSAWAHEHGINKEGLDLALEQIRQLKPDIVYLQDLTIATADFMRALRPLTEFIVGQIASPVPPQADLQSFDIIISSFPHFVERFRQMGITSYYQPLGFDRRVVENIGTIDRDIEVSFVGGISVAHADRLDLLNATASLPGMQMWGYGLDSVASDSPIRICHNGEVWGLDMFRALARSRITINHHIDVSEHSANNMRLYEATGCGALLITDHKDNLDELFEIGKEIVTYRSPEECVSLVKYYQQNPQEAAEIARAGQARTLSDHSYAERMTQSAEFLERHISYKRNKGCFAQYAMANVQTPVIETDAAQVSHEFTAKAWCDQAIPLKQRDLVQTQLDEMYHGQVQSHFQALTQLLQPIVTPGCTVLEMGCSSGYYYEILSYLLNMPIRYTGIDISEHFIDMAQSFYPSQQFLVADCTDLPLPNQSQYVSVSSGLLLHVPRYKEHIAETVRVAERYVVAHRTPICRTQPTQYFRKQGYGVEMDELHFNEIELLTEFLSHDLRLAAAVEYATDSDNDSYELSYLFEKK